MSELSQFGYFYTLLPNLERDQLIFGDCSGNLYKALLFFNKMLFFNENSKFHGLVSNHIFLELRLCTRLGFMR